MYTYLYIYTSTHLYMTLLTYIHACMHACIHKHTYVHRYIDTWIHGYIDTYIHTCGHIICSCLVVSLWISNIGTLYLSMDDLSFWVKHILQWLRFFCCVAASAFPPDGEVPCMLNVCFLSLFPKIGCCKTLGEMKWTVPQTWKRWPTKTAGTLLRVVSELHVIHRSLK